MKELFIDKFENTFGDLLKEIQSIFPNTYQNFIEQKTILKNHTEILRKYYENTQKVGVELSEKNEIIFSKDIVLIEGINFYEIWNSEITIDSREIIWRFLHIMYLYANQAIEDTNLSEIMKLYKKASKKENLKVPTQTKILFGILDNICNHKLGITSSDEEIGERCKDEDKTTSPLTSGLTGGLPIPSLPFNTDGLLSGQIGEIANEIANELDTSNLEEENPGEVIQNLLSGNMAQDSPVFKLVHQISDKIQNKLTSGDIDQNKLFKEAQGAMKIMGGNGEKSPFNFLSKMTENLGFDVDNVDKDEKTESGFPKQLEDKMSKMIKDTGMDPSLFFDCHKNLDKVLSFMDPSNVDTTVAMPDSDDPEKEKRKALKAKLKQKKKKLETKKQLDKLRR